MFVVGIFFSSVEADVVELIIFIVNTPLCLKLVLGNMIEEMQVKVFAEGEYHMSFA